MKKEEQLSVINTDVLSAFFLLKKLKNIFESQFFAMRQGNPDLKCKEEWESDFNSAYVEIWCFFENMLGEFIKQNTEKQVRHAD